MIDGGLAEHELEVTAVPDDATVQAEDDRELLRLISAGRRVPVGGEGEKLVAAGLAQEESGFLALTAAGEVALQEIGMA